MPTVQWITYFLGDGRQFYSSLNIGFAFAYFCLKLREGIIIGKVMVQSFRRVFEVEELFDSLTMVPYLDLELWRHTHASGNRRNFYVLNLSRPVVFTHKGKAF